MGRKDKQKIKNRKQLETLSSTVYCWLLRNNYNLLEKHLPTTRIKHSKLKCMQNALLYKTPFEWINKDILFYTKARKYGWLEECTKHMTRRTKWTKLLIIKESIGNVCRNRGKTAGGYRWAYCDEKGKVLK